MLAAPFIFYINKFFNILKQQQTKYKPPEPLVLDNIMPNKTFREKTLFIKSKDQFMRLLSKIIVTNMPMEYLEYYTEEEMLRHSVRPGITGLAQVTGRNNTKWDLRLQLDVYYVKNRTLRLDIQIILKTIKQVFMRDGVVAVPSEAYQKLSEERKN